MLSTATLELLQELQDRAHAIFEQGGVLYTYVEAANQAHSRFPESRGSVSQVVVDGLARFLQVTQQGPPLDDADEATRPSPSFVHEAQSLMACLRDDLSFDEISLALEGEDDVLATVSMARRKDNRFFSLELWWSTD